MKGCPTYSVTRINNILKKVKIRNLSLPSSEYSWRDWRIKMLYSVIVRHIPRPTTRPFKGLTRCVPLNIKDAPLVRAIFDYSRSRKRSTFYNCKSLIVVFVTTRKQIKSGFPEMSRDKTQIEEEHSCASLNTSAHSKDSSSQKRGVTRHSFSITCSLGQIQFYVVEK